MDSTFPSRNQTTKNLHFSFRHPAETVYICRTAARSAAGHMPYSDTYQASGGTLIHASWRHLNRGNMNEPGNASVAYGRDICHSSIVVFIHASRNVRFRRCLHTLNVFSYITPSLDARRYHPNLATGAFENN